MLSLPALVILLVTPLCALELGPPGFSSAVKGPPGFSSAVKGPPGLLFAVEDETTNEITDKTSEERVLINDVIGDLKNFKQEVRDELAKINKDLKVLKTDLTPPPRFESCKQIWESQSSNGSGVYQISVGRDEVADVYCQMTPVSGCSGGGWTMVMKTDGTLTTFRYDSAYWMDKNTYNNHDLTGFDHRELKSSTYWETTVNEICIGMEYNGTLKAFSFSYPARSLYHLIADGYYRPTTVGRAEWKSLINGSSLQYNCNREGFNVDPRGHRLYFTKVRIGILGNEQDHCLSPDSFVGVGARGNSHKEMSWCGFAMLTNTAGSHGRCDAEHGNMDARAMAYILVR